VTNGRLYIFQQSVALKRRNRTVPPWPSTCVTDDDKRQTDGRRRRQTTACKTILAN